MSGGGDDFFTLSRLTNEDGVSGKDASARESEFGLTMAINKLNSSMDKLMMSGSKRVSASKFRFPPDSSAKRSFDFDYDKSLPLNSIQSIDYFERSHLRRYFDKLFNFISNIQVRRDEDKDELIILNKEIEAIEYALEIDIDLQGSIKELHGNYPRLIKDYVFKVLKLILLLSGNTMKLSNGVSPIKIITPSASKNSFSHPQMDYNSFSSFKMNTKNFNQEMLLKDKKIQNLERKVLELNESLLQERDLLQQEIKKY